MCILYLFRPAVLQKYDVVIKFQSHKALTIMHRMNSRDKMWIGSKSIGSLQLKSGGR